jgi:hypothetical protein
MLAGEGGLSYTTLKREWVGRKTRVKRIFYAIPIISFESILPKLAS